MQNEDIIKMNDWLIRSIATKFYHADFEDLYQAGALGVIKAYKNYQKNGTTKFSTYAYDYVFGEMYQMVYKSQSIKVSKDVLKLYQKIEITRSTLAQKLNHVPTNSEIAQFLEMDLVKLEQVILMGGSIMCSLDEKDNKENRSYYETISSEERVSLEDSLDLKDCMNSLNADEQKIIQYRYFSDLTQSETAEKLNMTQVMVSRYEKKGLQKMRDYYGEYVA